jgi:hypothetical protein
VNAPQPEPGPEPEADAVDRLVEPGHCCRCDKYVKQAVDVAYVPGNSGPGYIVRACIPHARRLARYQLAPQWLKDDLAALDADLAARKAQKSPGLRSVL